MNKQLYSEDHTWYNEGVYNAITTLADKYDNAIPIFGGALGAYNYINCDTPDFERFVKCLSAVVHNAIFFKWHEGVVGALRRFCRLCLVDPALIECYMGLYLDEFANKVG